MTFPGIDLLIKIVLTALPTYLLAIFKMPKWGIKKMNRYMRNFLWKGHDHENVRGGHWSTGKDVLGQERLEVWASKSWKNSAEH
jgi:hypothetical protein